MSVRGGCVVRVLVTAFSSYATNDFSAEGAIAVKVKFRRWRLRGDKVQVELDEVPGQSQLRLLYLFLLCPVIGCCLGDEKLDSM